MEQNGKDLKSKYVVTSKPSEGKSTIGNALFALAIIFMVVAAVVCCMLLKESQTVAIAMMFVSILLGLCLIGISNVIKNQVASSQTRYYIEEYVEKETNTIVQTSQPTPTVSKDEVRNELMTLIHAVVKEELKNVKYTEPAPTPVTATASVREAAKEEVKAEKPAAKTEPVPAPVKEEVKAEKPVAKTEPTPAPVTASVKEDKAEVKEEKTAETVLNGKWKCNVCGHVNHSFMSICACGTRMSENNSGAKKADDKADVKQEEPKSSNYSAVGLDKRVIGTVSDSNKWECKLCGKHNGNNITMCQCGQSRVENDSLTKATASTEVLQRTNVNIIKSDNPILEKEERPKNVDDYNSTDYDVAAAREAEEKKLAEEAAKAAKEPSRSTQISADEWRCNVCNRVHRNYVGTCACGNPK